jgi:putative transposase
VPDYRRNRVPGGTFFLTVNLLYRHSGLLVTQIQALRDAVRRVRRHAPFRIDAWVVLPDHMHCLWTLSADDADFPDRWRAIKTAFSKALPDREWRSPAMTSRGERGIWQRRSTRSAMIETLRLTWTTRTSTLQPGEARACETSSRLAAFVASPMHGEGVYPAGWIGGDEEPLETGERR